jgi:thiamine biosynthesis lipoprotein
MGTRFEIFIPGESSPRRLAAAEAAIEEVQFWHGRLSLFDRTSFVSHINAHGFDRPIRIDGDIFELLSLCERSRVESEGAFDVAVGAWMRELGFRENAPNFGDHPAPDGPGFVLDPRASTVQLTRRGTALDFGAVAKGFALDRAAALLRSASISSALLHGGTSSVVAIGSPPEAEGWAIGLECSPWQVLLRDRALGVSSPHGRTVNDGQGKVGHIVDPRTNRSTPMDDSGVALAAVTATSAALADIWSTAAVVLGRLPATSPDGVTALVMCNEPRAAVWIGGPNVDVFRLPREWPTIAEEDAA